MDKIDTQCLDLGWGGDYIHYSELSAWALESITRF